MSKKEKITNEENKDNDKKYNAEDEEYIKEDEKDNNSENTTEDNSEGNVFSVKKSVHSSNVIGVDLTGNDVAKVKRTHNYDKYYYELYEKDNKIYKSIKADNLIFNIEQFQKPKEKHQIEMFKKLNHFNKKTWTSSNGLKTGWSCLDKALNGLQPGFHVIGGDSNLGKSSFLSQLEYQLVENNENIYVISFSLDDPEEDKISRVIASSSKIPINIIKQPKKYRKDANFQSYMARRELGLNNLYKNLDKYKIYDATKTTNIDEIYEILQKHIDYFKENNINKKVVAIIDNFHDLTTNDARAIKSKNERYEVIAEKVSDTAIQLDIPIICTAELKKTYTNNRPSVDDLREAVKIKYEAKSIMMVYSEVHYKGENAKIYYLNKNKQGKQPVFEVEVKKNKFSEWKGRMFFEMFPELAYFKEASVEATKQYKTALKD